MRGEVRFIRRGRTVKLPNISPTLTLLDYLRLTERATGTKEGCAEGDCGACTVVLRRLRGEKLTYEPVNACILLAGQADGSDIITVEDLARDHDLHPVQQAMVDLHGSQCGFCTPGFVMALFALYHRDGRPVDRALVNDWIAGNLCRCTGYRPIVEAGIAACAAPANDWFSTEEPAARQALSELKDGEDIFIGSKERFFAAPAGLTSLAKLYLANPDATLVAGATDVGLWVTKQLRDLPKLIWLGRVKGLDEIEDRRDAISFGATVTHADAMPYLAAIDRDLGELLRRFAGNQIRTAGTVGGNIANGSPIGDLPPALIALGATLALQHGDRTRTLPLESYFIDYGKQDRRPGEFVRLVRVPKFAPDEQFRCYKISKRFDSDISAVMGAFKLRLDGTRIAGARIAFGGMAAIPKRARAAEKALIERRLDRPQDWNEAVALLAEDFSPIDDLRASAKYRLDVARALLRRALTEIGGAPTRHTRLVGFREVADVGAA
jgi:xanthine dehydrogenase small subunit